MSRNVMNRSKYEGGDSNDEYSQGSEWSTEQSELFSMIKYYKGIGFFLEMIIIYLPFVLEVMFVISHLLR